MAMFSLKVECGRYLLIQFICKKERKKTSSAPRAAIQQPDVCAELSLLGALEPRATRHKPGTRQRPA